MIGPLGFPEILLILLLALVIFGPKRLPELGRTLGKGMREFRRATTDLKHSIEREIDLDDELSRGGSSQSTLAPPKPLVAPAGSVGRESAAGAAVTQEAPPAPHESVAAEGEPES